VAASVRSRLSERELVDLDSIAGGHQRLDYYQPSPTGDRVAWFRPAKGSAAIQGPFFSYSFTQGTIHPNEFGHQAIKEAVLANVVLPRTTEMWIGAPVEEVGLQVQKHLGPHD